MFVRVVVRCVLIGLYRVTTSEAPADFFQSKRRNSRKTGIFIGMYLLFVIVMAQSKEINVSSLSVEMCNGM